MERKRILLALVTVILMVSLVACERPASRAPTGEATATTESSFPVPGVTEDVMGQLESFATQTAIAMAGGSESPEAPVTTPSPEVAATEPPAQAPTATTAPQTAATATTAPAAPSSTFVSTVPSSWTLRGGEHPYCIARRFNVNPDEMLRVSGLSRAGSYPPGTVLKIPTSGSTFPANRSLRSHPTTYNVSSGETIYSIACLFGDVDPFAIAAANNLQDPYRLDAGMSLNIP